MKDFARFLFAVADTVAYLQMFVAAVLTVQLLGQALTVTFAVSAAGTPSEVILASWAWFAASLTGGAILILGCYLHLKRQILGVFLIAFVLLLGLLVPFWSFALAVALVSFQLMVYALPWSLMYMDLRKKGVFPAPD